MRVPFYHHGKRWEASAFRMRGFRFHRMRRVVISTATARRLCIRAGVIGGIQEPAPDDPCGLWRAVVFTGPRGLLDTNTAPKTVLTPSVPTAEAAVRALVDWWQTHHEHQLTTTK